MAKHALGGVADRLFRGFMAPLVIGGEMTPGKPIGGLVALAIGDERVAGDPDLVAHVQLARVRAARLLVPIDRVDLATDAEWALACALHDIVQSSHPDFAGAFKRKSATRLLDLVDATLDRVAPATTLGDALSRHTWFARLFEITRTDTTISWWVGSAAFLGETPPERLTAWPELRRVQVRKTPRPLLELPLAGGSVEPSRLPPALAHFLKKTPLTDLATCTRAEPLFAWSAETLAFVGAGGGRALALRAMARLPAGQVDLALGRATRALLRTSDPRPLRYALDVLSDRALAEASAGARGKPSAEAKGSDALFACAAGAVLAREQVARGDETFGSEERKRLLQILEGPATSEAASNFKALFKGPTRPDQEQAAPDAPG